MLAFVVLIVIVALAFDFLNGMNDAANSIATVVSTRVLSPRLAVLWAAFFNLAAAFFFGVHVATTIGRGVIDTRVVDATLILSTLSAAILWTYVCTRLGLPISVSHSLVGGLVGTGLAKAGLGSLVWSGLLKIAVFIALAPLVGTILGYLLMVAVY
jgi:PiT family inorganic phosphate transporter